MTMTKAFGQWVLALSATSRMIGRLMAMRSSRLCPGLRGMPAVTMMTSAPAQSLHFDVPTTLASKPRMAEFCSRSRALPLAKFSFGGMSKSTTSPSCFSQARFASSPPMLPAPMRAIFFRVVISNSPGVGRLAHVPDDGRSELAALHFFRAVHETREVVRHRARGDRAVHSSDDELRRLAPAQVPEHHLAREDDRARVDLVEVRVLRGRAVRRFEDRVAGEIVDVAARRDADAADLRGERVGE